MDLTRVFDSAHALHAASVHMPLSLGLLGLSLLAKAFRGELVPQDPNDEPASELLKRLAASARSQANRW